MTISSGDNAITKLQRAECQLLHVGKTLMHTLSLLFEIGMPIGMEKMLRAVNAKQSVKNGFLLKDFNENQRFFAKFFSATSRLIMGLFLDSHPFEKHHYKDGQYMKENLVKTFKQWCKTLSKQDSTFALHYEFIFKYSWVYFEMKRAVRNADALLLRLSLVYFTPLFHRAGKKNCGLSR
eukprot:GILJ01039552.1.p1 GENE.GILJ01039552.1~~GILJ01039552.1.p1  ORF type:complete len:179 (+),score=17.90 GILJ01039552.1:368-904(+)